MNVFFNTLLSVVRRGECVDFKLKCLLYILCWCSDLTVSQTEITLENKVMPIVLESEYCNHSVSWNMSKYRKLIHDTFTLQ